jgi:hypothetical protein
MGLTTCVISKVMVAPGHEFAIASRRDPAPLSALLVTIGLNPQTAVLAVPLSFPGFGSAVADEAVALFEIGALAAGSTATVRVNTSLRNPREAEEQDTVPPAPTAGVVQDQPPGALNDANVVSAGNVSEILTVAASLGPALVAVMV